MNWLFASTAEHAEEAFLFSAFFFVAALSEAGFHDSLGVCCARDCCCRKQTVGNACGTVGLLHCALNASVSKGISLGKNEIYKRERTGGGGGSRHITAVAMFLEVIGNTSHNTRTREGRTAARKTRCTRRVGMFIFACWMILVGESIIERKQLTGQEIDKMAVRAIGLPLTGKR